MPRVDGPRLKVEVRILTVFSRIIGEIVERQRAAIHTANVSANIATSTVLTQEQFKVALLDLLSRKADMLGETEQPQRDVRLPFLLLSAHSPDPDEYDPAVSGRLKNWLVETLHHLEWRSFVRSHMSDAVGDFVEGSFIGELPGVGMMIALDKLVSKDELDRIRNAFPTKINPVSPTNSPVKLVVYVLDVPAQRILDAASKQDLPALADDVESWGFDVATVVGRRLPELHPGARARGVGCGPSQGEEGFTEGRGTHKCLPPQDRRRLFFVPGGLARCSQVRPRGGHAGQAGAGKWPRSVAVPGRGCSSLFG